MKQSNCSSN